MMLWSGLYIPLLFLILSKDANGEDCHKKCKCKWKENKRIVDCVGAGLTILPKGLNNGTQVLNLAGNFITHLPTKGFHFVGLINLQKVYLSRCGLVKIADDAFYHLANLIELDLSHNFLIMVPVSPLKDCPLLRRLQLSNNPINRVENESFASLKEITTLELVNCQIESIEPAAFKGLQKLEFLRLNGNRLHSMLEETVVILPKLRTLDLNGNPWFCDCGIRGVRVWMVERKVPYSIPPTCERPPRLRNMSWDALHLDEYACPPHASAPQSPVTANEADNATLECKVEAMPDAAIHWIWRDRVVYNLTPISFGRQMYVIRETGDEQPKISSLTIYNVMIKDAGTYICVASNKAGNVSTNVTLIVNKLGGNAGLTGGEIVAIVIGILLVATACFVGVCLFVLRRKPALSHSNSATNERKTLQVQLHRKYDGIKENHFEMTTVDVPSYEPREDDALSDRGEDKLNSAYGSNSSIAKSGKPVVVAVPPACNSNKRPGGGGKATVVTFAESPDESCTVYQRRETPSPTDYSPPTFISSSGYGSNPRLHKLYAETDGNEPCKPYSILKSANNNPQHPFPIAEEPRPLSGSTLPRGGGGGGGRRNYLDGQPQHEHATGPLMTQTLGRHDRHSHSHQHQHHHAAAGRTSTGESQVFKYDNSSAHAPSSNYGAALYGTWKRGTMSSGGLGGVGGGIGSGGIGGGIGAGAMAHISGNPLHLALSPEARDSPDEGLGDEREYETDIME